MATKYNPEMDSTVREALCGRLLALADDELILAHRNSEWAGHGPILEEDIAFSNIALDEMGHAAVWYGLLGELDGRDPDQLIFFRYASEYRNVQMVELPRGDWAFTLLRQYLFDAYEQLLLAHLADSRYRPLVEAAAKLQPEERYHLRHTASWVRRLGLGTEESNGRMQDALKLLWPYARQFFVPLPGDQLLADEGVFPALRPLQREWEAAVGPYLQESGLHLPQGGLPQRDVSRTEHTEHLMALLNEMQAVARMDPAAAW
jgi:ring-1,2-phenylacetyl-CoA epoxidase subunit PaaC